MPAGTLLRRIAIVLYTVTYLLAVPLASHAQDTDTLPPGLPNPLVFADGRPVTTPQQWAERRTELLHLFTEQMYGKMPPRPAAMRFHVYDRDAHALDGLAVRKQIAILLNGREDGPRLDVLLYIPKKVKHPAVILGMNFWGNETVNADPGIRISTRWVESGRNPFVDLSCVKDNHATAACRGIDARRWPIETILRRGYAFATLARGDIDPDRKDGYNESIRSLYPELQKGDDNFSTIAAWAWGYSRALDYLETDRSVDGHRVVIFGWSRLGKASLWAAANDPRFAALLSNESGTGGVRIFHHAAPNSETVHRLTTVFPYWYCRNFRKYDGQDLTLPFDQNEVLALVAPRPVYIGSAIDDHLSDPRGEFLSGVAVTPVYRFLGSTGLPVTKWPAVNQPVFGVVSYHVRSGGHDVTDFDWEQYLTFLDRYLKPVR
jgi:hypothetical protein